MYKQTYVYIFRDSNIQYILYAMYCLGKLEAM